MKHDDGDFWFLARTVNHARLRINYSNHIFYYLRSNFNQHASDRQHHYQFGCNPVMLHL